jgi:CIC family chloride channel protein
MRGVVLATEVEQALSDGAVEVTAAHLARGVPLLRPEQGLEEALAQMTRNSTAALPVQDGQGRLIGWVTSRDLLRTAAGVPQPETRPERETRRLAVPGAT